MDTAQIRRYFLSWPKNGKHRNKDLKKNNTKVTGVTECLYAVAWKYIWSQTTCTTSPLWEQLPLRRIREDEMMYPTVQTSQVRTMMPQSQQSRTMEKFPHTVVQSSLGIKYGLGVEVILWDVRVCERPLLIFGWELLGILRIIFMPWMVRSTVVQ